MIGEWITGVATLGLFLLSLGAVALSHGAHRARTEGLEGDLAGLQERVTALETLKISVEGLTRGIEHLGDRLIDSQKLSARELDEVKHGVRNIRQTLEREGRSGG